MTTCIGGHDEDPPLSIPGLLICHRCHQRLIRDLHAIVGMWGLLTVMLQPGNAASGGSHGKPGSRPPCDLDVADITDPRGVTSQQLVSWARVVIEDRNLSERSLDAEQAARLLTVHVDWLAGQPFADEAMVEIHDAAYRIRRVCHDLPEPPIGTCPDVDPRGEADVCGGPLRIHSDAQVSVVCARCGSQWGVADLPLILRAVQVSRKFPVPRLWVADRYNVAPGTLRQWIRRGHVRTYSDEQVDLFDVLTRVTEG